MSAQSIIIGVDEVGRGSWLGPIVAAAFICSAKDLPHLKTIGVKDSKKLSAKQREVIAKQLRENFDYLLSQVSAKQIDQLGLQVANVLVVEQAIKASRVKQAQARVEIDYIGGFTRLRTGKYDYQMFKHGESQSLAIAAASIIAKTYRDGLLNKLAKKFPQYDLANNKGYGTNKHWQAIKRVGVCLEHRLSFGKLRDYKA